MKTLTVKQAARKMKKAQTTLYGMIESGEVPHSTDEEGRIAVSPTDVASAPRRKRGHPFGDPETFRGKLFMELLGYGYTVTRIANRYGISRQAVSKAIARYKERTMLIRLSPLTGSDK